MEEQKKNPAQGLSESEQVQVRRQKLADLQAAGHDPFTLTKFPQDAYSADLKEEFKDLPNETDSGKKVALAGRLMSKRVMGKASFAHLRDDKGDIQLYVRAIVSAMLTSSQTPRSRRPLSSAARS